jgi:hypothetical protein
VFDSAVLPSPAVIRVTKSERVQQNEALMMPKAVSEGATRRRSEPSRWNRARIVPESWWPLCGVVHLCLASPARSKQDRFSAASLHKTSFVGNDANYSLSDCVRVLFAGWLFCFDDSANDTNVSIVIGNFRLFVIDWIGTMLTTFFSGLYRHA